MSDAPVSWNDPNGPQPVTDRDGQPLEKRDGSPLTLRDYFASVPQPEPGRPVTYSYAPRIYGGDNREVLEAIAKFRRDLFSDNLTIVRDMLFDITQQGARTMATQAEMKAALDALTSNVDRFVADAKAHAAEQAAKLDELKAISDNGTEAEFDAAIEQIKAASAKLATDAGSVPVPVPTPTEPAPVPVPETPPVAEVPPVSEQPAPDAPPPVPTEPAPDAPPADPNAPQA